MPEGCYDLTPEEQDAVVGQMADIMLKERFGIDLPDDIRGRVTILDPKNMTDEEIEDGLAFINEGMPES